LVLYSLTVVASFGVDRVHQKVRLWIAFHFYSLGIDGLKAVLWEQPNPTFSNPMSLAVGVAFLFSNCYSKSHNALFG
jgi:uncharacterized metal-binding protein